MELEMSKDTAGSADVAALVAQARLAYQQNRIKECLTLVRTVLQKDPSNAAALEVQAAVRFDMQRDLSDARALIEESRNKPDAQKFRKAAEIILLKALYLDPESEGAKILLSSIRSPQETPRAATPVAAPRVAPVTAPSAVAPVTAPSAVAPAAPVRPVQSAPVNPAPAAEPVLPAVERAEVSGSHSAPPSGFLSESSAPSSYGSLVKMGPPETIPFTTGTSYDKPAKTRGTRSGLLVSIVVVGILVIGGGLMLVRQWLGTEESASSAAASHSVKADENPTVVPAANLPAAGSASSSSSVSTTSNSTNPASGVATNAAAKKSALSPTDGLPPVTGSSTNEAAAVPAASNRSGGAVAPAMGSLAVSSPVAAEIYLGDKLLGSTPTTLQLPAGNQTLEYRHGDLRAVVTHVVKANETTPALITFDVIVQLNAKPWANVFIEGSTRIQLGQTPLSNVKLPIGSVLVFENPNFPSKSHKIAVDDKTIQMVFQ